MPTAQHHRMLNLAKEWFELDGFKTYVTEKKIPDMIIWDEGGHAYAVEVLTHTDFEIILNKIRKYLADDIDGIYFIIPHQNTWLAEKFSKEKVAFIPITQLLGEDTNIGLKIDDEFEEEIIIVGVPKRKPKRNY